MGAEILRGRRSLSRGDIEDGLVDFPALGALPEMVADLGQDGFGITPGETEVHEPGKELEVAGAAQLLLFGPEDRLDQMTELLAFHYVFPRSIGCGEGRILTPGPEKPPGSRLD